jgi:class 3 adenylate cyclase
MVSGQLTETAAESTAGDERRRRWWLLPRMSIQSKVLVMLLVSSIASVAVVGLIGREIGRNSMRTAVSERLIELRESQQRAMEMLFADLTHSLVVYAHGLAVEALHAFTEGFDKLAGATITPVQQEALSDYYINQVVKPARRDTGAELDLAALVPTGNAQRYLQAYYTIPFTSISDARQLDDARDGSAWSAANARYNGFFREVVSRFDYGDALLLDTRGNIVYSMNDNVDLGSNIRTGPYRGSNLGDAYEKALDADTVDFTWITDFQPYQPQHNAPTAWLVTPIGAGGSTEGVLALQLPVSKINRIMTAQQRWDAAGMGATTETYLAGPDGLMRSDSRLFLQDPTRYRQEAVAAGTPKEVVDEAIRLGGTTLVQPVSSRGLRAAQRGQTGIDAEDTDYLGNRVVEAYTPLAVPGSDLHWSIVATREISDAFARVSAFSKTLILTVTAIIFIICVAAMLLAQIFVRPIRRLEAGTLRISEGKYDVAVPVTSRDEFGDLTAAFNEMSRSLEVKEALLDEQRRENDRLLLSLMPEQVLQRYRRGEQTIAQEHQDVTVIFAEVVGFDETSYDRSGDEFVRSVDTVLRQFDSAAESCGMERIRTLHNGYLAACGLTIPRLDHVRRAVDFAVEISHAVEWFNGQTGYRLALRASLGSGQVISGLVGRAAVVHDIWGPAVSLVYRMQSGSSQPGIYTTERVYEVMHDVRQFTPAGVIVAGESEQPIWRLSEQP